MKKEKVIVKPGDKCLDHDCNGKFVVSLVCNDDACGNTVHPADGYKIEIPAEPKDEGELTDIIERYFDLLTCYNCGKLLKDQSFPIGKTEVIGTMLCDPGEHNYPHSPDEPGGLYFECNSCAEDRRLRNKAADFKARPTKNLPTG